LLKNDSRNQWVYKTVKSPYYGLINTIAKYYSGPAGGAIAQTPLVENCYAFRLSEAYLLESEAITLSGGNLTTAKTLLQRLCLMQAREPRKFAAVANANTAAALQLQIVKENMRNFVFENGLDWFAVAKAGYFGQYT